jgi:hypothetical protein
MEPSSQPPSARPDAGEVPSREQASVSEDLERWLKGEGEKTLGSLIELFREKSFALLFVILLGVPALPLPTGGATHVFEVIAVVLAVQLIAGRDTIWLPERWRRLELAGGRRERFIQSLLRLIRRLERFSRPRGRFLFDRRSTNIVFGLVVIAFSAGAFLAPPFSGLDTLPALGVVLLSLGMLLEDVVIVVAGLAVGVAGIVLDVVLGRAAIKGIGSLLSVLPARSARRRAPLSRARSASCPERPEKRKREGGLPAALPSHWATHTSSQRDPNSTLLQTHVAAISCLSGGVCSIYARRPIH